MLGVGERIWRSIKFLLRKIFSDLGLLSSDLDNPAISKNGSHAQNVFSTITIPGNREVLIGIILKHNS